MTTEPLVDPHSWYADLHYLGQPGLIATAILETDDGLVVVDPGPTTALPQLEKALKARKRSLDDIYALLLTHIHLDHAGATGTIVERNPDVLVYVHVLGARYMVTPKRLIDSARRIYGDDMERLWGDFLPVDRGNVHALSGGETIRLGRRIIDVAYTPGHAQHHLSYYDRRTGIAFVGDTCGMRIPGESYVMPQAPPPDIDVAKWHQSLDAIAAWKPTRLFVTHAGPTPEGEAAAHIDAMHTRLDAWAARVRDDLASGGDDAGMAGAFDRDIMRDVAPLIGDEHLDAYDRFGSPETTWHGLARYWRKQA